MSFIGEEAAIVSCEKLPISNFVVCELLEVSFQEQYQAEDTGMLYLYPIDDQKFCLQLYFKASADNAPLEQ